MHGEGFPQPTQKQQTASRETIVPIVLEQKKKVEGRWKEEPDEDKQKEEGVTGSEESFPASHLEHQSRLNPKEVG